MEVGAKLTLFKESDIHLVIRKLTEISKNKEQISDFYDAFLDTSSYTLLKKNVSFRIRKESTNGIYTFTIKENQEESDGSSMRFERSDKLHIEDLYNNILQYAQKTGHHDYLNSIKVSLNTANLVTHEALVDTIISSHSSILLSALISISTISLLVNKYNIDNLIFIGTVTTHRTCISWDSCQAQSNLMVRLDITKVICNKDAAYENEDNPIYYQLEVPHVTIPVDCIISDLELFLSNLFIKNYSRTGLSKFHLMCNHLNNPDILKLTPVAKRIPQLPRPDAEDIEEGAESRYYHENIFNNSNLNKSKDVVPSQMRCDAKFLLNSFDDWNHLNSCILGLPFEKKMYRDYFFDTKDQFFAKNKFSVRIRLFYDYTSNIPVDQLTYNTMLTFNSALLTFKSNHNVQDGAALCWVQEQSIPVDVARLITRNPSLLIEHPDTAQLPMISQFNLKSHPYPLMCLGNYTTERVHINMPLELLSQVSSCISTTPFHHSNIKLSIDSTHYQFEDRYEIEVAHVSIPLDDMIKALSIWLSINKINFKLCSTGKFDYFRQEMAKRFA